MGEENKKDKYCSLCKYFWSGHGFMYCTHNTMQRRITAGRKNGCKKFEHYKMLKEGVFESLMGINDKK